MRSSIIETLGEDYVTTARAKGLPDRDVLRRHACPNALLPTVTLIAINLGYVVAGRHHGRGRLQLARPRDADGRRACRPRLPGPPGHLPDPVGVGRRRPTSAPTSSTAFLDPRVRGMTSPAVDARTAVIRRPRRRRLPGRATSCASSCGVGAGCSGSASWSSSRSWRSSRPCFVGPLETATTRDRAAPRAAAAGLPPRDRRAGSEHRST